MKELNYVFVGKAKDFNLPKILLKTIENKKENERKVHDYEKDFETFRR